MSEESEKVVKSLKAALRHENIAADILQEKVSNLESQLTAERQAREAAEKNAVPVEVHGGLADCGHNRYWTSQYGNCMACRSERAEAQVKALEKERDGLSRALTKAKEALAASQTALIVNFPERTDCVLGIIRAALLEIEKEMGSDGKDRGTGER